MNGIDFITKNKLIVISRGVYDDDLIKCAELLIKAGVKVIEVTFDQSSKNALIDTGHSISLLKEKFDNKLFIGAGTVMNKEQVLCAKDAGADFALAPNTDIDVIKCMKQNNLIAIPGALTPSEIVNAYNAGADLVKVFPIDSFNVEYIKSIKAPISHIPLIAVGGVNHNNAIQLLNNGYVAVGVGSYIINSKLIKQGNYDAVFENASKFVNIVGSYK